jgi:hypothetical protein
VWDWLDRVETNCQVWILPNDYISLYFIRNCATMSMSTYQPILAVASSTKKISGRILGAGGSAHYIINSWARLA